VLGIAVHDHAAAGNVQHPILDDAGAGVERGFGAEVKTKRGIRHFDGQMQIVRLRVFLYEMGKIPLQYDEIRLRLVGRIVLRRHIDRCLLVNRAHSKDPYKPSMEERQRIHVRPLLAHFVD